MYNLYPRVQTAYATNRCFNQFIFRDNLSAEAQVMVEDSFSREIGRYEINVKSHFCWS